MEATAIHRARKDNSGFSRKGKKGGRDFQGRGPVEISMENIVCVLPSGILFQEILQFLSFFRACFS